MITTMLMLISKMLNMNLILKMKMNMKKKKKKKKKKKMRKKMKKKKKKKKKVIYNIYFKLNHLLRNNNQLNSLLPNPNNRKKKIKN